LDFVSFLTFVVRVVRTQQRKGTHTSRFVVFVTHKKIFTQQVGFQSHQLFIMLIFLFLMQRPFIHSFSLSLSLTQHTHAHSLSR
jgi:hypothetical protein